MSRITKCLGFLSFIAMLLVPSASPAQQAMTGPLIISELDTEQRDIAVAYNSHQREYLVVWANWWSSGYADIYAQRVNWDGRVLGPWFAVAFGTHIRTNPSVAYDSVNGRYLVAWSYDLNDDWNYDLWGRFIPWYGPDPSLTEFAISSWSGAQEDSVVVYNEPRQEFLVVWTNRGNIPVPDYVSARRVWADGSGFPGGGFTVASSTTDYLDQPDVAYNFLRDEYLVTFAQYDGNNPWYCDVNGVRLNGTGGVLGGGSFAIGTSYQLEKEASISWCHMADTYLVVWHRRDTSLDTYDVFGRFIGGDGAVDSTTHVIRYTGGASSADVSCMPETNEYLVVWEEWKPLAQGGTESLQGRRIPVDLNPPISNQGPVFTLRPDTMDWATNTVVTAGNAGWLAVWEQDRSGGSGSEQDIHGRVAWELFCDGFESGDTMVWSSVVP